LAIIVLIILTGGYWMINDYQKKQLVMEAQENAIQFIENNYENINQVTINKDNYKFYPKSLGGLGVTGYVNNDTSLYFSINYGTNGNELGEVTSIVNAKNFPPEKEECQDYFCE
jgi:hypothetical protein